MTHNSPFRAGKGYVYEGGLRVPLIVDGPGLAKKRVIDTPLINTDWLPTLLELAGVRATGEIDGRLAAEARADLATGRTTPLDPEKL